MKHRLLIDQAALLALVISVLAIALSLPPLRSLIEQSMLWHMVIQMPMLVLAGWLSMRAVAAQRIVQMLAAWNRFGLTGFIAALGILACWMLPLAIDRAIVLPQSDALKLATLFACGAMLEHSALRAPAVLEMFFVGTIASMMIWLGLYYASTDQRLCNACSLQSQTDAGWGFAALAITLGGLWLARAWRRVNTAAQSQRRTRCR